MTVWHLPTLAGYPLCPCGYAMQCEDQIRPTSETRRWQCAQCGRRFDVKVLRVEATEVPPAQESAT